MTTMAPPPFREHRGLRASEDAQFTLRPVIFVFDDQLAAEALTLTTDHRALATHFASLIHSRVTPTLLATFFGSR
jgi:hypothetical protein